MIKISFHCRNNSSKASMGKKLPNQSISGRIPSYSLQLNHKTKKLQPANMLEKTKKIQDSNKVKPRKAKGKAETKNSEPL